VLCVGVLCAPSQEGDVLEIETEMETGVSLTSGWS